MGSSSTRILAPIMQWLLGSNRISILSINCPQVILRKFRVFRLSIQTISPYNSGKSEISDTILSVAYLTCVQINAINGSTDTDLLSLMSLKYLIRIYLSHSFSCNKEVDENKKITFKGSVAPLLKKFGHSLEVLDMSSCGIIVDIWTILKDCPCLTCLCIPIHCDHVSALPESELTLYRNEKEWFILKNLDILHLYSYYTNRGCTVCTSFQSSYKILHFLLSFTSLEEIRLYRYIKIKCIRRMQKFLLEKYGQYFQIHIEECGINGSILKSVNDCYHLVRGYGNELHLPANNMKDVCLYHFLPIFTAPLVYVAKFKKI